MPEFVVVRHGRPLTERLESGIADPSLDEFGRWQAERVCAWLAHEPVDAVVASPKARAIETVQPLVDQLDVPLTIVADLDEIDRFSSVYVPTDMWATEGLDILEALGEKRYADIGYDPPDVFRNGSRTSGVNSSPTRQASTSSLAAMAARSARSSERPSGRCRRHFMPNWSTPRSVASP